MVDKLTHFEFNYVERNKYSYEESKETQWKCLEIATTISELGSIFYDDSSIIDYDGRGLGDWRDFKSLLEDVLLTHAEDKMMKSIGEETFLKLKATDAVRYKGTLESAKRIVGNDKLNVILMTQESFKDFFDMDKPYARMVIPYKLESTEDIRTLVEQNWGKSIKSIDRGYIPFDIFMDKIEEHIDASYLLSAFEK